MTNIEEYIPIRLSFPGGHPFAFLGKADTSIYDAPFLIQGTDSFEKNKLIHSQKILPLNEVIDFVNQQETAPIRGFIFHISKCGSTLTKRMLDGFNDLRNVAEPSIINQYMIRSLIRKDIEYSEETLKALMNALFINNQGNIKSGFIKFAGWQTSFIPYYKKAFPNVPWMLLYRKPTEIISSRVMKPDNASIAQQSIPELAAYLTHRTIASVQSISNEEYLAEITYNQLKTGLDNLDNKAIAIDYKDIKSSFFEKILPHFGLTANAQTKEQILANSVYHSSLILIGIFALGARP